MQTRIQVVIVITGVLASAGCAASESESVESYAPLSEAHPEASHVFLPLRRALCGLAGRPVNIQATVDFVQYARDLLFDQPFFVMVEEGEGRGPTPEEESEALNADAAES
jgi:hypothetical protein